MQNLSVTLIQSNLHWEDKTANLAMLEEKIWKIGGKTDVIVLPEMFTTGFSMSAGPLAEMTNERTFKWMKQMAAQTDALILGSHIAKESGKYFNRLIWMQPDGEFQTYDKRHLFRMGKEEQTYASGDRPLIATWKGWNICPLVCYDLRFPVWSRNKWDSKANRMNYDVLIYVANWPQARVNHWDALLQARAIENLSFVVGVNRIGTDGKGIPHNGHSAVFGPKGENLFAAGENEVIQTVTLDSNVLSEYRSVFPAYLDGDDFTLR